MHSVIPLYWMCQDEASLGIIAVCVILDVSGRSLLGIIAVCVILGVSGRSQSWYCRRLCYIGCVRTKSVLVLLPFVLYWVCQDEVSLGVIAVCVILGVSGRSQSWYYCRLCYIGCVRTKSALVLLPFVLYRVCQDEVSLACLCYIGCIRTKSVLILLPLVLHWVCQVIYVSGFVQYWPKWHSVFYLKLYFLYVN